MSKHPKRLKWQLLDLILHRSETDFGVPSSTLHTSLLNLYLISASMGKRERGVIDVESLESD